jgi:uncharacterized membrane protein
MIRRYFIAGLLVWVPLWVTLVVIGFFSDILDKSFELLPANYHPDHLLGFHIPGLGIIFTLLLVLLTGMLATNFFGTQLVRFWEALMARIPVVRSIYAGSKQVMQTILKPEGEAFKKALLVRYPHQGSWTIGFQTGTGFPEVEEKTGTELVLVFVPTTPNPTAGFLMFYPKKDTIELNLSVEAAFKLIISLGVVKPIA